MIGMNKWASVGIRTLLLSNGDSLSSVVIRTNLFHAFLSTDPKETFIEQLQGKYENLYQAIRPIPFLRDGFRCVNDLYVESGLRVQSSKEGNAKITKKEWVDISSLNELFSNMDRCIIEGEAGYGKSTLALQLAYGWCNKSDKSPLQHVDILILLRLRELGGIDTFYEAIEKCILPKDTTLGKSDIGNIIAGSKSVLIILDGFDEYPDQENGVTSEIIEIIKRERFQDAQVILTTRSSVLPKNYAPQTKRVSLTGFDKDAQVAYLQKAVVDDDKDAGEAIMQHLQQNPVIGDLCQVPLFFAIYSHISYKSGELEEFTSVTSFFRYMITCFHFHLKNKIEDAEELNKCEDYEKNHKNLNKLAFEGLCENEHVNVWTRTDVISAVGENFLNHYLRIGILIEEESFDETTNGHLGYIAKVRFHHKLFCEWYAAHHLGEQIAKDNRDTSTNHIGKESGDEILENLSPFELQYMFRFACGINPNASEKIIQYISNVQEGEKFAVLCILEQGGRLEHILETVRELCCDVLQIGSNDSRLQRRATIQLLSIAAVHQVRWS